MTTTDTLETKKSYIHKFTLGLVVLCFFKKLEWAWWCTPIIPSTQEDLKFQGSTGNTVKPCLKKCFLIKAIMILHQRTAGFIVAFWNMPFPTKLPHTKVNAEPENPKT